MHLLPLLSCLVLGTRAAPSTPPRDGTDLDIPFVGSDVVEQEAILAAPEYYLDEPEYDDMRIPVMLLTPREREDLIDDMQDPYEEQVDMEEHREQQWEENDQDVDEDEDEEDEESVVSRKKRQLSQQAIDLALSHTDRNGNNRRPGRIHGRLDLNGIYDNRNNHHTQAGVGLGSVLYRSKNGRHSVGVGAYGTQGRGRSYGYRYRTQPQWGAGIG